MNFWKALFGTSEENTEEEQASNVAKQFDLMKYDGVKAMKIGQWDYAVKCFNEALKIQDDMEVHEYLSRVLIRLDRLDEAMEELKHLTVAEPQNVAVLQTMAHVAYMKEDYAAMAQACERAIAIDGEVAMSHYLYGQAALGQNDLINGIARLTKAIVLDEQMVDARLLRAQTLLKMGDVKGADEDAQWLMQRMENQEDVLLLAARVARAQGQIDKALTIYNKVVELNPFSLEAYQEQGKIYYDQGKLKLAEENMKKVLELNPQQLADVSGDYSAEGVEQQMKRAYSMMNPFGI